MWLGCLEGVVQMSGRCGEAYGGCWEAYGGVVRLSEGCLEAV